MTETTSAYRCTTGAVAESTYEPRYLKLAAALILFALALAVVTLRFHRLDELPPGIYFDEGVNGLDALQVLQGKHAIYFPENFGREPLGIYLMALAISILGRTELAIRLPTALASGGTVLAVFWLGRVLFARDGESERATPWRGLLVGGVGAGLLSVSLAQTIIGRTSFRANFLPLLLTLCLGLMWEGWRRRSWQRVALAGACAGLLPYTYIAARFTPFLFLFLGLSFLMPMGDSEPKGGNGENSFLSHRLSFLNSRLRAELPLASSFVGVVGILAAPILVYFVLHPNYFFLRSSHLSVFQHGSPVTGSLWTLVVNVWEHLLAFGIRGDLSWRHNYPDQPMLNIWQSFFFWLGGGTAVWRWQQPTFRLLILWLALMMLPAMLSSDGNVPHFLRMFGATPAIYLLTGVGVWVTIRFLRDRISWGQVKWAPDFRREGTKAATVVGAVAGLILIQGTYTYRAYFQEWAAAPDVNMAYEKIWTDIAVALNELPSTGSTVHLIEPIADYAWRHEARMHPSFEYLYTRAAATHLIHATATHNWAPKIKSILTSLEKEATVHYVDRNNRPGGGNAHSDRQVKVILDKYGRYLKSDSHDGFQIHSYTDFDLNRPWTYYDYMEPSTVHYDGGISFLGFALGQGTEQLSMSQQFDLKHERAWWIAMQWQTVPGLEAVFSISLRLYDAAGSIVYQQDAVLENAALAPTDSWLADKLVDTLYFLEFPSELLSGEYELRMVVYDFETLIPTVEQGVWEAEKTLAGLKIGELE